MTKTIQRIIAIAALAALSCFGQAVTTQTTLGAAVGTTNQTNWSLASCTGTVLPSVNVAATYLMVDQEAVQIRTLITGTIGGSGACTVGVSRGLLGTRAVTHTSGSVVWIGNVGTGSGDASRPFSGAFAAVAPQGSCVATAQYTLPVITTGQTNQLGAGAVYNCLAGRWTGQADKAFWVPPTACTFAPTTLTTTNTYIQVGASTVFVLNGLSNAAAGTNTLTCNIYIPSAVSALRGTILLDITLFVGSQTAAPTSLGTSTLSTITFPAAATSETASTVTPVAIGGTVTTVSPTQITTVTTAGSFLTIRHTYATAVDLSTDLRMLVYTMPFAQSAAAAMAINTPGLLVHYAQPTTDPAGTL